MGLDQYAFTVAKELAGDTQVDFDLGKANPEKIAYWRKFNALHGWMEDLYRAKGGQSPDFNCDTVRLNPEDLDALQTLLGEHLLTGNSLKPRSGFFFGSPEIYPEDLDDTMQFIKNARQAIEDGKAVFYDSWW